MRCGKAKKLLTTYTMGKLEGGKGESLNEHLTACSECADELESLRETWDLLGVSEEVDVPEHLAQEVERQVASLAGVEVRDRGRRSALQWSLTGAGLALVCCILALLLFRPPAAPEIKFQAGEIEIGFYLDEHERAAQYVSFHAVSRDSSPPRWVAIQRENMFYYDGSEDGSSGVFLRSQDGRERLPEDGKARPAIAEGELITLSKAQKLMPFSVVAPEVLGGNYELEVVVKIKDSECIQLVYSDGVHTLSLFQQPLWTENGIPRRDFQEYILHKTREEPRSAVLGWLTSEIAFNFVGEIGFSELMRLAEEIQEKIATDSLQNRYEELYGR